jgi:hypothetical protein
MDKMKESKDLIIKGHKNRFDHISDTFKGVLQKYPDSRRSKKMNRGVDAI